MSKRVGAPWGMFGVATVKHSVSQEWWSTAVQ